MEVSNAPGDEDSESIKVSDDLIYWGLMFEIQSHSFFLFFFY